MAPPTAAQMATLAGREAYIQSLNSLTKDAFMKQYLPNLLPSFPSGIDGEDLKLEFRYSAADMTPSEVKTCLDLIETTSAADYRASGPGWDRVDKESEMREGDMRYLLLTTPASSSTSRIPGFVSFMLTLEDEYAVLYVYEVHLDSSLRGKGMGKALMKVVEDVAGRCAVQKIMLTVFTANSTARGFYKSLGYATDPYGPQDKVLRRKVKRPKYYILSKVPAPPPQLQSQG